MHKRLNFDVDDRKYNARVQNLQLLVNRISRCENILRPLLYRSDRAFHTLAWLLN